MRIVSKDYIRHMTEIDFTHKMHMRLNPDSVLFVECNNHTYEITNFGTVIACFDGLNYVKCYDHSFADMYISLLDRLHTDTDTDTDTI